MITNKDENYLKTTHSGDDDLTMICHIYETPGETPRFSFWQSFPRDF